MPALAQRRAPSPLPALSAVPACPVSAYRGAVELDGQGVLEVVPPPPPASRWAGVRCASRARRPRVRRRWAGLGRRLGPCPLPLPALAAIEGARALGAPVWREVAARAAQTVRKDYAETLGAIVTALADHAGTGSTSAPTWLALAQAARCAERTVARWIAWLRERRLLVTVEHGSTEATRPASMALEGNRAAVYALTAPLPDPETTTQPTGDAADVAPGSVTDVGVTPLALPLRRRGREPSRGRESTHQRGRQHSAGASPPWGAAGKGAEDEERPPDQRQGGYQHASGRGSRGDQRAADLAIATALRRSALDLRSVSDAAVRSVIRPLTAAGWDVADLIHAIDHTPDGATRWYTSAPALPVCNPDADRPQPPGRHERPAQPVASPTAWLRWRLAPWQGQEGPVTARRAATVEAQRVAVARRAAQRAVDAATLAASTTAPAGFTAARAALRAATYAGRPTWTDASRRQRAGAWVKRSEGERP